MSSLASASHLPKTPHIKLAPSVTAHMLLLKDKADTHGKALDGLRQETSHSVREMFEALSSEIGTLRDEQKETKARVAELMVYNSEKSLKIAGLERTIRAKEGLSRTPRGVGQKGKWPLSSWLNVCDCMNE